MGLDFDIIDDKGEIIDRYGIKWLYDYDKSFIYNYIDIKIAILYCDEQINILKINVDECDKIKKIKHLEFMQKKEYLSNLINNTNNNEELDELIEKIYNQNYENIDNYLYLIERFKFFKSFLENNNIYQGKISW